MLWFAILGAIYQFLTNVNLVVLYPEDTEGIVCVPEKSSVGDQFCQDIAKLMANATVTTDEWQCSLHTNFVGKSIYDEFPKFGIVFGIMLSFGMLYAVAACVHDIFLVEFAKNNKLDEVAYWPKEGEAILKYSIKFFCCPCGYSLNLLLCGCQIFFYSLMFLMFLPIFALEFFGEILYRTLFVCKPYCCAGFNEVSGVLVGIATAGITWCAFWFTQSALVPLEKDILSLDMNCRCYCQFFFTFKDFGKLSMASFTLLVLNLLFLREWYNESKHSQWSLYLIKYTMPVQLAHIINPNDPTASTLKVQNDVQIYLHAPFSRISQSQPQSQSTMTIKVDGNIFVRQWIYAAFTLPSASYAFQGYASVGDDTVHSWNFSSTLECVALYTMRIVGGVGGFLLILFVWRKWRKYNKMQLAANSVYV